MPMVPCEEHARLVVRRISRDIVMCQRPNCSCPAEFMAESDSTVIALCGEHADLPPESNQRAEPNSRKKVESNSRPMRNGVQGHTAGHDSPDTPKESNKGTHLFRAPWLRRWA
jgi:hypothetical protein